MARAKAKKTELKEFVQQSKTLKVDVENAVLEGVRILGLTSANNRTYLREGVTQAIPLYEGKATNIDHPSSPGKATPVSSRNGWLSNVVQEADGGLRGNWQLLKSHPMTPLILEVAQRNPSLLGLSHNATGKTRHDGGREIVESIDAVHSVDLVADPATVSGLHEGKSMKTTAKKLMESLAKKRPGYARGLKEMAEAGLMSPDQKMEEPSGMEGDDMPDAPPEAVETVDHEQAILDAAKACLEDSSLTAPEKMAKIKKLLGLLDSAEGPAGSGEGGDDDKDKMGPDGKSGSDEMRGKNQDGQRRAMFHKDPDGGYEGRKSQGGNLQEQRIAILEAKELVRRIAGEQKVMLPEAIIATVKPGITDAEAKQLVESFKSAVPQGQQPRSAGPPPKPDTNTNNDRHQSLQESSKRWVMK